MLRYRRILGRDCLLNISVEVRNYYREAFWSNRVNPHDKHGRFTGFTWSCRNSQLGIRGQLPLDLKWCQGISIIDWYLVAILEGGGDFTKWRPELVGSHLSLEEDYEALVSSLFASWPLPVEQLVPSRTLRHNCGCTTDPKASEPRNQPQS